MNKITYLSFVVLLCFSFNGSSQSDENQRVRLDFVSPLGYSRHLLLTFTPDDAATDAVDYGYDALNRDYYPDDLNWIIEDDRYVIQGVGAFHNTKYYPFGMFLSNSGEIEIVLTALENFETPIDVYVYDALFGTFTAINDSNYIKSLMHGEYLNRFYITFNNNSELISNQALSLSENEIHQTSFNYNSSTKELLIKTNTSLNLKEISLYDVLGKKLVTIQNVNSNRVRIPLSNINTRPLIVSLITEDGKQLNKPIITRN
ncbi:hypothetical protein ACS386_07430 [Flavobacteriaceae bacterium LMO-SS05]